MATDLPQVEVPGLTGGVLDDSVIDVNDRQLLLSSNVQAVLEVDLAGTRFLYPDRTYSGFAADGYRYDAGVRQEERASWAEESPSEHASGSGTFPSQFLLVLTDRELSIIDVATLQLFMRFVVYTYDAPTGGDEDVPGIFAEFVPDESLNVLGSSLGLMNEGMIGVQWCDHQLVVHTERAVRVADFRADRVTAINMLGIHQPRLEHRSGIAFRNLADFYGDYPVASVTLPANISVVRSWRYRATVYHAVGTEDGLLAVLGYTGTNVPFKYETNLASAHSGPVVDIVFDRAGQIYLLMGSDPIRVLRSVTEWRSRGLEGRPQEAHLPRGVSLGDAGQLLIRGRELFIKTETAIWRMDAESLATPRVAYTAATQVSDFATTPSLMVRDVDPDPLLSIALDPTTGNLAVMRDNLLEVVNPGNNKLLYTLGVATSPVGVAGYRSDIGGSL